MAVTPFGLPRDLLLASRARTRFPNAVTMDEVKVAQLIVEPLSAYDTKCQQLDYAGLAANATVSPFWFRDGEYLNERSDLLTRRDFQNGLKSMDVLHAYGSIEEHGSALHGMPIPFIASRALRSGGLFSGRVAPPAAVVSPTGDTLLPEAVAAEYFGAAKFSRRARGTYTLGTFVGGTERVRKFCEQTLARLLRFRDDLEWELFETAVAPDTLSRLDLWVDPRTDAADYSGFTAEALVSGLPVVAARTSINRIRLEDGLCGFLFPPADPNELAHAVLAALFKPEAGDSRLLRAAETADRFLSCHRMQRLVAIYQQVIR